MLKLHETQKHPLDATLWVSGYILYSNRYVWILLHNNLPTLFHAMLITDHNKL